MVTAKEIIESIPSRFRKEKCEGYNAVVHLNLSGAAPLQYTIRIAAQQCTVSVGLHFEPDCEVVASAENYAALETGTLNPQWALVSGKVKVSNVATMLRFTKCFRRFEKVHESKLQHEEAKLKNVERPMLAGPLSGVKIVDFTRLLPGPIATMFLAQQGAEVIKIEDPDNPDYIRSFEPQVAGVSAYYLSLNANKKSIAINFLTQEGRACLLKLIKTADVLVEQFRPGVMKKFGLDFETLSAINPQLIYVSITGYGATSFRAKAAGHDMNYIAESGLPFITGTKPTLPGFQAADVAGGAYMAMNAITTALFQRTKDGKGTYINVAMADCVLPLMVLPLAAQQLQQQPLTAENFELAGSIANYNIYQCADKKYIALGALEPKFWSAFCQMVHKPEWQEKIIASKEEVAILKQEVATLFYSKNRGEWLQIFAEADVCVSPLNDVSEVLQSPYFSQQKMFIETEITPDKKLQILRHPVEFGQSDFSKFWSAPTLGEDTAAVLSAIGVDEKNIKELAAKGIVK